MAQYEDLIAKLILQVALEGHGRVERELEVPPLDSQFADLFFEPVVPRGPVNATEALLTKMTIDPSVMEPFSRTPTVEVLQRGPLRKQMPMFHNRCLEAFGTRLDRQPIFTCGAAS